MYTSVMLIWLIDVYWMLPVAWQNHWMIEALPSKISIPFTFPFPPSLQCYFENLILLVLLFSTLPFYFKLYKISTGSIRYNWNFVACRLIKYNGFQSSDNKSYETPYWMMYNERYSFGRYFFHHWVWLNMFLTW